MKNSRIEYLSNIKKQMFDKFKKVHNNEYDYDENSYVNSRKPFNAICKIHGKFKITVNNHLEGNGKCPKCYSIKRFEKYIDDKRYYICEIHGDVLIGKSRSLTQGCPECNIEKQNKIILENHQNNIINKFGENYNITFNSNNTITFICKKHNTSETV